MLSSILYWDEIISPEMEKLFCTFFRNPYHYHFVSELSGLTLLIGFVHFSTAFLSEFLIRDISKRARISFIDIIAREAGNRVDARPPTAILSSHNNFVSSFS